MSTIVFNPFTGNFDFVAAPSPPAGALDWRIGVVPSGVINGVNKVFTISPLKFIHDGKLTVAAFSNGQRLLEGATEDYTVSESGGFGTGHDTLIFTVAPVVGDNLQVDFVKWA